MTFALLGISASKGIAIGNIYVLERGQPEIREQAIRPRRLAAEVKRFERALEMAREQLRAVKEKIATDAPAGAGAFIDTHLLMLDDAPLKHEPTNIIRERRCNAEWALKLQRDALVSVFDAMDDPYLRSRRDDVNHVVNRIQRLLIEEHTPARASVSAPDASHLAGKVVFADDLAPADTVLMEHHGVAAFVTEYGGPNSHTAILARSLRIPAVVGLHQARDYLRAGEAVIVDGRQGVVLAGADEAIVNDYRKLHRRLERHHAARRKLRRVPVVSSDGERIVLQANVELATDIEAVTKVGAEGVGLYRTEFLFMNRERPPDEEEQVEAYVRLVKALRGAPVTIRTLDLGADKQVDGARPGAPMSTNPALGLRAVRLCLREPELFRPQLRAILRASAAGPVRMMVPMLSNPQEFTQVMQILDECRDELRRDGHSFDEAMPVGGMIEVPAAAICADMFARSMDFLSIGTNDLIQYTIAIDRCDDEVNYLYDPLHPGVLRLIQMTIRAGARAGVPVAMCGEMAGDARYTRLLLGMGLTEFSVHPNALLEIKQMINSSDIGQLKKLCQRVMRAVKPSTRAALVDEIVRTELD